nr:MAG TPA: hypothetical protein [Caudoviricetes sp.]DAY61289.1 MAG TPA: hypothetical protein [Caudoviricetes sp.]
MSSFLPQSMVHHWPGRFLLSSLPCSGILGAEGG